MTDLDDQYEVRRPTADEFDGFVDSVAVGFAVPDNAPFRDGYTMVREPDRELVAVRDGQVAGTAAVFSRELTVPGGPIAAAHVTDVTVQPTHRRRGLLRRLMTHQLTSVPEPVAALWASEGRIYQRFGYGMATRAVSATINSREVTVRPEIGDPTGRLRAAIPAEVRKELADVHQRLRATVPGMTSRSEVWWGRLLRDVEAHRNGATERRAVIFEDSTGTATGYALWRVKREWTDTGPAFEVRVEELLALTPGGYAELWRFLLDIDLARVVRIELLGPEEPLLYLVNEPVALGLREADGLWLRLVDLPRALEARRYSRPVDAVLEVSDALLPANAGRWRLRVAENGTATCTPAGADGSDPTGDIACDIADLAAAYLGDASLAQLARAGRVRELRPGTLEAVATAFGWPISATAIEIF